MQFTTQREDILDVLKTVTPICAIKTSFRICDCCLICAKDKEIIITGTDVSTIAIRARYGVNTIREDGCVCVDARHLQAVIAGLPKGADIHFESDNGRLKLTAERFKSSLPSPDVSEFPNIKLDMPKDTISIPSAELRDALRSTLHCASNDASRPEFMGTQMSQSNGHLSFVATDGHRLNWFRCESIMQGDLQKTFIIPATAQSAILKILKDGDVRMGLDKSNKLHIEHGSTQLQITGISGKFPDFQRVIPDKFDYTAEIDRQQLATALGLLGNFEQNHEGKISHCAACHFEENRLVVSTHSDTKGEVSSEIDADTSGNPRIVGLDSKYMADAVSTLQTNLVRIDVIDPDSPVLFTSAEDTRLKQVIMPMEL